MIFVTVGSQKFQFNRLLKEVDAILEEKKIREEIFAQIGYSDYIPQNYKYKRFLDRDEFKEIMGKSQKVITHGGTGAIISAVKHGKKVIAIPRLKEYGEHVDDHQLQVIEEFESMKFIKSVYRMEELESILNSIDNEILNKYVSNSEIIIEAIERFIVNE